MRFEFRVDLYVHQVDEDKLSKQVSRLADLIVGQTKEIRTMAGELDLVKQEVIETQAKFDRVAAALTGLIQKLIDNQSDPAALQQIAADLDAAQGSVDDELAAAEAVLNPPAPPPV